MTMNNLVFLMFLEENIKFFQITAVFDFGIDAVFVRVLWILVCLFPPVSSFVAIAAYILLGYIIPEETDYIDV